MNLFSQKTIRPLFAVTAVFAAAQPAVVALATPPAAALVNGEPVAVEEYRFFQEQERANVVQLALTRCGLKYGRDFWDRRCAGTTPRAMLQKKTVERVVREKAEQLLFRDLGLISNVSHAAFLTNLEKLNAEREAIKARGGVLYGPVRYDPLPYYGHWKATLQIQAREKLGPERLAVSEESLRRFYQQNRKRYTTPALSDWETIIISSAGKSGDGETKKAIAAVARQIRSRWKSNLSAAQLVAEFAGQPELSLTPKRFTGLDDERLAELFSEGDTFARMQKLKAGRTAILPAEEDAVRVLKCVSRTPGTIQPFEKARSQLRAQLLRQRYDELVKALVAKADVVLNREVLAAIPVE